jgi:hypothetical protein
LLAAIRALAKANAGLGKVIVLAADRAAMRADRAVRPQNAFQMGEGGGFDGTDIVRGLVDIPILELEISSEGEIP